MRSKQKILILDDDSENAEYLRDCLITLGYDCDIGSGTPKDMNAALSGEYICVILGELHSGMDEILICSKLRKTLRIPIIFVTSNTGDAAKIRAFNAGADDYITKPFSISEVLARVNRAVVRYNDFLQNPPSVEKNVIKIRGLEIHKDSHRVFVDGSEVQMPVKEYELLLFLAENPNMVFSKEHLLDRVWGIDAIGDSATVTVHIQRIREKIEKNGNVYIETVWGAGYRLNVGIRS